MRCVTSLQPPRCPQKSLNKNLSHSSNNNWTHKSLAPLYSSDVIPLLHPSLFLLHLRRSPRFSQVHKGLICCLSVGSEVKGGVQSYVKGRGRCQVPPCWEKSKDCRQQVTLVGSEIASGKERNSQNWEFIQSTAGIYMRNEAGGHWP